MTTPDVIVRETLFGRKPGEERFAITITVERPFPWGDISPTEYACRITVDPFRRSFAIHGGGPLQALCLALQTVRWELDRFLEEGGSIEDFDLNATLPFRTLDEKLSGR